MNELSGETAGSGIANPYAPSGSHSDATTDPARLKLPAWIAIACCVATLGFWLVALIVSLPYGHRNAPPLIKILAFTGMFTVLPGLGIAGGVAMLNRKHYALALIGAISMVVPLLGPCFGLTIPVGIWSLVLLRRKSVRDSFAQSGARSPSTYSNADDAIAAASRLDRLGEWDAAIALYRSAAERWPEHASYIENCVDETRKKQAATR